MKLKHTSFSLSCGLLTFLGSSVGFLFFLVHQPVFLRDFLQKTAAGQKEAPFLQQAEKKAASSSDRPIQASRSGQGIILDYPSAESVHSVFKKHGFNLERARRGRQGVPRIYLSKLPRNWKNQKVTRRKKMLFICMLLPLILEENERIEKTRARIITLFNRREARLPISDPDKAWLRGVAKEYGLRTVDQAALLARVDIIPPSLALAQAILETGFGSSSAAMHKNSIFGHMKTLQSVRAYTSLKASVTSYIQNLNKHEAYQRLRALRAQMRQKGKAAPGYALAQGLEKYSIRGGSYVREIQRLIQYHRLDEFDKAVLRAPLLSKRPLDGREAPFSVYFRSLFSPT